MKDNIPRIPQMPANSSVQGRRLKRGTSDSLKLDDKRSFSDVVEDLAAKQKKGTKKEKYINEKGERIMKITSDRGIQYRKLGDVDDVIWSIPVIPE